jgi:mono/diheme cytochrome c family protein/uncharacterized membrane protein
MTGMLLSITEFIGRFHPVLVHLPIGILLIGLLLQWLSKKEEYKISPEVIKIILLCGMFSALVACVTGYMLSLSGDYEEGLVGLHMWMGLAVAAASMLLVAKTIRRKLDSTHRIASISLLILIIITGHLGGSLTHGSDYLTAALKNEADPQPQKIIPNIQEAKAYDDVIQPLLESKCYSCHGPKKQKGKLRLDDPKWMMKGGEDGVVLVAGKGEESELIKRILLAPGEEHHMPPKQKSQLTEKQISLLHWWIDAGADFTKKIKELPQTDKIKPVLLAMQNNGERKLNTAIPASPVEAGDQKAIQALTNKGVIVMPVAQNNNYLMASFVSAKEFSDSDMNLLMPLQKQLVWLKIGGTRITDSALFKINSFANLTQLDLSHTAVTDKGVSFLKDLKNLQWLNLVGTQVTASALLTLSELKRMQTVYLFRTKVNANGWNQLIKTFPKIRFDTGGYSIPFLSTDTIVVRTPRQTK